MNEPDKLPFDHFAEEIRCNDEIQLLEGPTLELCPIPGFEASVGITSFGVLLFEAPTSE